MGMLKRLYLSLRVQFYLLFTVAFAGTTISGLCPSLILPIFILLAIGPALHIFQHRGMSIFYRTGVREVLMMILAYLLITVIWTPDKHAAMMLWLKLFGLFLAGCLVSESLLQLDHVRRQDLMEALVGGLGFAVMLVGIDIYSGYTISHLFGRSGETELKYAAFAFCLFIWPALAYLLMRGKIRMAIMLGLAVSLIVLKIYYIPAIITMIVTAVCLMLIYMLPRLSLLLFLTLVTGVIAGIPAYVSQMDADKLVTKYEASAPQDQLDRLYLWEMTAKKAIAEGPMGAGLGSAGHIKLNKREAKQLKPYPDITELPQPENMILYLWLELGVIGLFGIWLLTVVLCISFRRIAPSAPLLSVMALSQIIAICTLPLQFTAAPWDMDWLVLSVLSLAFFRVAAEARARNATI